MIFIKEFYLMNTIGIVLFVLSFFFNCFLNPGIVEKETWNSKKIKESYQDLSRFKCCEKCDICVPKFMKTQHCDSCGLCIENSSHHSFIFEKCIGKYNFFIFFSFVLFAIMYVTRTALLFLIIIYIKICSNFKQLCLF